MSQPDHSSRLLFPLQREAGHSEKEVELQLVIAVLLQ